MANSKLPVFNFRCDNNYRRWLTKQAARTHRTAAAFIDYALTETARREGLELPPVRVTKSETCPADEP